MKDTFCPSHLPWVYDTCEMWLKYVNKKMSLNLTLFCDFNNKPILSHHDDVITIAYSTKSSGEPILCWQLQAICEEYNWWHISMSRHKGVKVESIWTCLKLHKLTDERSAIIMPGEPFLQLFCVNLEVNFPNFKGKQQLRRIEFLQKQHVCRLWLIDNKIYN